MGCLLDGNESDSCMYDRSKSVGPEKPMRDFSRRTAPGRGPLRRRLEFFYLYIGPFLLLLLIPILGYILYGWFVAQPARVEFAPQAGEADVADISDTGRMLTESGFMDAYLAANGGREALLQLSAVHASGRILFDGEERAFALRKQRPNLMLLEMPAGDSARTCGYDGKLFWQKLEAAGTAPELALVKRGDVGRLAALSRFWDPLLAYGLEGGGIFQIIEFNEWRGGAAIRVQLRAVNSSRLDVYVHPDELTILATVERAPGSTVGRTTLFSDYRVVGGLRVPFYIKVMEGDVLLGETWLDECELAAAGVVAPFLLPEALK